MLIACIPATEFKSRDKWRLFIIDHVFTLKYFLCVIASQTGRFDKEKRGKNREESKPNHAFIRISVESHKDHNDFRFSLIYNESGLVENVYCIM